MFRICLFPADRGNWHANCYLVGSEFERSPKMYDRRFFSSKLGQAAAISVAAMVAFNLLVLSQQLETRPLPLALSTHNVELA